MSPIPACSCRCSTALGAAPPAFAHEALLVGSEGKLAKRLGSLGVEAMREAGIEPIALDAKLARIGTSLPVEPVTGPGAADRGVRFRDLRPRAGALRSGRADARSTRASSICFRSTRSRTACPPAWPRPTGRRSARISGSVAEAADWWEILHGHVERARAEEDRDADRARPPRPPAAIDWGEAPWPQLVARLKETSGRTGKALFLPLRRALTGRDSGPEMAALLPLIGRDETVARLRSAAG